MITNKGTIYLSGGGDVDKTTIIDSHFIKSLPRKEILYIPIAMERDLIGYEACYDWLTNAVSKLSEDFIDVSMVLDLDKNKDIKHFSAIYIGGGNTYKLLKVINRSGFSIVLKDYIQNGGIIYGGSAGAIILGKDISTVKEENIKYNYGSSLGLSLIGDYSIICHYQEDKDVQIKEYLKENNNPVIAIPEGVGLVVKGNLMTVLGVGSIAIFEKDEAPKKVLPGVTLPI